MRTDRTGTTKGRLARLADLAIVPSEEQRLAGAFGGGLYVTGGITLGLLTLFPDVTHAHRAVLLVLAGSSCVWGLCAALLIDWNRAPRWLLHLATVVALGVIAVAVASSGGATSPVRPYLFVVAVFAAYFYASQIAGLYLVGCLATHAAALLYDPRALSGGFLAQLMVAGPAYIVLGGVIIYGRALTLSTRSRAERLAAEQGALQRVATAVVSGEPPERFYELVAVEAAALLGAGAAGILRVENALELTVVGSWADHPGGRYQPGTVVPVRPGGDVERALRVNRPVRVDQHPAGSPVDRLGYSSSVVAPVRVADRTWGLLTVSAAQPGRLTREDEQRLLEFGDLLATAITSIEDREKLAAQASSDPLTGLANHRTLQERLAAEVSRGVRHGTPVAVAVIDIDHFKQVNDFGGHEAGDEMLTRVAGCLAKLARVEDILGRVGGDEFAWVLPETTREQALVAVERARRLIAADAPEPYRLTVSAGICDTRSTEDPTELLRLADGALYWSKAHGRDQCWIYDPEVVNELSAQERADRLERSQALAGLQALARAIDAKDPATTAHSERVARLVERLARAAGWSAERAALLRVAALVHDVGKIAIPDSVLLKTEPLSAAEREQIELHAELAGRIVEGVLSAEQAEWVRTQHERPDGRGYPRGLRDPEISEGAGLLALADAWDSMTAIRSPVPRDEQAALEECVALAGTQFTEEAVAALLAAHAAGQLRPEETAPAVSAA